jgi:putative addiction module component (TIGR02574 family)
MEAGVICHDRFALFGVCGKLQANNICNGAFLMSLSVETLASEVLRLPPSERSQLLDRVIASLDADHERDAAWDALAARRDAEIESGQSQLVPGEEALARLYALLD